MARTMSLTRDFTSHVPARGDGYATSHHGPSGFLARPRRHTESDGSQPPVQRRKSASNLLDTVAHSADPYVLDEDFLADGGRKRMRDDDVAALVYFFKHHAPPSDNFMSIPYGGQDDDRGRWSKIKRMSKRSKSMPRPREIRLPDSAVSGTTIGGHRHIAISIPFDASPFGDASRSQYPIFNEEDTRQNMPRNAPIHTFTNEKGVVTVLRTVNEDREPASPSTPLGSHPPMPWSSNHRQSGSLGRASLSTGHRTRPSTQNRLQDPSAAASEHSSTPIFDQYRTKPATEQQKSATSGTQSPKIFQRSAYPQRQSSMPAPAVAASPTTIDGMISPTGSVRSGGPALPGPSRDSFPPASAPGTPGTDGGHGAVIKVTPPVKAKKVPKPLDFAENVELGGLRNDRLNPHTPALAESPLLPPNDTSGPPTPRGSRSRRDLVRDRKRRDIEAMRNARQKQMQQDKEEAEEKEQVKRLSDTKEDQLKVEADTANRLSTATVIHDPKGAIGTKQDDVKEEKTVSNSGPTLSPIVVVVDVQPDYGDNENTFVKTTPPLQASLSAESLASAHVMDGTDASALTPPHSADESAPRKHNNMDRTSLSRRREWNATREQERKAREAKEAARAKAKQLVSSGASYDNVKASQTDKEILRLYEAYRDHRLREMERRVRRLERNGDVWLRALVPVLDNVNRTMSGGAPQNGARDYASDDEAGALPQRQSGSRRSRAGRDGVPRRASLSQSRLMEELARKTEGDGADDWSGSGSGSDDASGLGTIEPLMRELAGEARKRQKTAQKLGVGADGRIFHAL